MMDVVSLDNMDDSLLIRKFFNGNFWANAFSYNGRPTTGRLYKLLENGYILHKMNGNVVVDKALSARFILLKRKPKGFRLLSQMKDFEIYINDITKQFYRTSYVPQKPLPLPG